MFPPPGRELARDVDQQLPDGADLRRKRRHARYAQREVLWGVSELKRIRECGRAPCAPKGQAADRVTIRDNNGVAHFTGLATCGSVWACPCCQPKILNWRAEVISAAAGTWQAAGNSVVMVTSTMAHDDGDELAVLLRVVSGGFRAVLSGRPWQRLKKALGIAGTIRSLEVTHGLNGWHPHLHTLVFIRGQVGAGHLAELGIHVRDKWSKFIVRKGYRPPHDLYGVKISVCTSAAEAGLYVAKTDDGRSVGNEVARGDLKRGKGGHRTPLEILEDFRQTGDRDDRDLWREYEQATRGHQRITWSKGLRELVQAEAEQSDEEIAAAEVGGSDVISIDTPTWRRIVKVPGLPVVLLGQAEQGGAAAVIAAAAGHGIRIIDRGGGP